MITVGSGAVVAGSGAVTVSVFLLGDPSSVISSVRPDQLARCAFGVIALGVYMLMMIGAAAAGSGVISTAAVRKCSPRQIRFPDVMSYC